MDAIFVFDAEVSPMYFVFTLLGEDSLFISGCSSHYDNIVSIGQHLGGFEGNDAISTHFNVAGHFFKVRLKRMHHSILLKATHVDAERFGG